MSPVPPLVLTTALAAAAAVLVWPGRPTPVWTPWRGARPLTRSGLRRRAPGQSLSSLVPEALELVALALLGGGSLAAALARVGAVLPGGPGHQLAEVGTRLHAGALGAEAWEAAGAHWSPAWRSLQLAESSGVAPGRALTQAAQDLRRDAVADVEVAAARLGVRLVLPLGLAYLPAFVLTTVLPVVLALTQDLAR